MNPMTKPTEKTLGQTQRAPSTHAWHGLTRPILVMATVAVVSTLATLAVTGIKQRKVSVDTARLMGDLERSAARIKLLETLLKRTAGDAKPLFEAGNSISAGTGPVAQSATFAALVPPSPAAQPTVNPAQQRPDLNRQAPTQLAAKVPSPQTSVAAQAQPQAAALASGQTKTSATPPHQPMPSASTASDTIRVAAAIAPVVPSADQVATARRNNPTEVVSSQQLGLQSLQPRQAVLKDGRMIAVGDVFPSGDRLLAIDLDNKQLITDRRTIILF